MSARSARAPCLRRDARRPSRVATRRAMARAEAGGAAGAGGRAAVVIGAGVAGLCAARRLHARGVRVTLLEASDGVGGRVRSDTLEGGWTLDRGFHIFLTAYPEAQRTLDYDRLKLRKFYPGALVRHDGEFHRVADPLRRPVDGVLTLLPSNAVGSPLDKVRVGVARALTLLEEPYALLRKPETSIMQRVRSMGFSEAMIDRFFRPFFGGIFFDRELGTTSRLFDWVFRMLATGENCLPEEGIGAVPDQLVADLPEGAVRLNTRVQSVDAERRVVTLADGSEVAAPAGIVVAIEGPAARALLGEKLEAAPTNAAPGVGTACVYFGCAKSAAPLEGEEPILFLNGDGKGMVNNASVLSAVAPSYAPAGKALVSVSVLGVPDMSDEELTEAVRGELTAWFGADKTSQWEALAVYRVPFAQPAQAPPTDLERPVRLGAGLYVCGDHRGAATLDAAILTGHQAAEALIKDFK